MFAGDRGSKLARDRSPSAAEPAVLAAALSGRIWRSCLQGRVKLEGRAKLLGADIPEWYPRRGRRLGIPEWYWRWAEKTGEARAGGAVEGDGGARAAGKRARRVKLFLGLAQWTRGETG
jgi:hypothetical protein